MSSRVLKKLHGENDLELIQHDEQLLSDMEVEPVGGTKKKQLNLNRYDLLNQQSPSESEVKEDDNDTEHVSAASNNASNCNISKKKKKKRKKKSSKHSQQISSEDNNDINEKHLNEIDKLIGRTYKSVRLSVPVTVDTADKSLLAVDTKNLNPHFEMRRTFGKRVVKMEYKRGRGQKPLLKSTHLVTPKESWLPVTKDIIHMEICEPPEGVPPLKSIVWFSFEHSKSYQNVQNMFLSAVERMDSDFLVRVIKRCPYHVDSLIQLSELCKMTENYAMASELIERAILILETSLHSTFSLTSGNSYLDYRKQENRAFFIVLFKHAQYLEGRACCRTAFEISKLILNLNPDTDPLAMILVIDYYALRSKQYAWLVKFYKEWETSKNLAQLPNMAYSYALSLFYTNGECDETDEALQYALLMFPGVLKPLLDELSIQTDSRVTSHSYFGPGATTNQTQALQQLVSLYICRAKLMWRDQTILPWLERNVNKVLDKVDNKDEVVAEYATKRSQRYVNPPRAILRHVVLSDYKEKVTLAPFITKEKDPIMMYDPLPPLDSINFYERKINTVNLPNSRPVSMFFQSMLPTFNLHGDTENPLNPAGGDGLNINLDDEDGAAGVAHGMQSYRELRSSLTSIVDAMRDFLSNISNIIPDNPQNLYVEENESFDEDSSDYYD